MILWNVKVTRPLKSVAYLAIMYNTEYNLHIYIDDMNNITDSLSAFYHEKRDLQRCMVSQQFIISYYTHNC